jgi:hypothetical protein
MSLIFAHLSGFWAFLGIPAVLLIHFLQRESRRLRITTLFLLEHIDRESVKGRRFDRLRQSIPLWLQLLAVLILTWILTEPRWTSARSVERVVLVLDHSASMEAFAKELATALRREIPPLTALVGTTEYSLIESTLTGSNLYRGTSFEEMMTALEAWSPSAGTHSAESALRIGRSLAGTDGTLVYVTDHPARELPYGSALLSVGEPLGNVGFSGLRVIGQDGGTTWQATLRNYAPTSQKRSWFLASGEERTEARPVELKPGETRTLQGQFPAGGGSLRLVLEPDRFTRDDTLHVVQPSPKEISVSRTGAATVERLVAELIASLDNVFPSAAEETPDLAFATYNPLQPEPLPKKAIVFLNQEAVPRQFFTGPVVSANDSIIADLDWQGLIARATPSVPLLEGEKVLLWQGERALILLREEGETRQLFFNFDVAASNAARLPAFVLLVNRFVNRIRDSKIGYEALNTELRQPLAITHDPSPDAAPLSLVSRQGRIAVSPHRVAYLRAPEAPGFFSVLQGERTLVNASANFADSREADFSGAAPLSTLGPISAKISESRTVPDPFRHIWLIALSATALLSWHYLSRATQPARSEPA